MPVDAKPNESRKDVSSDPRRELLVKKLDPKDKNEAFTIGYRENVLRVYDAYKARFAAEKAERDAKLDALPDDSKDRPFWVRLNAKMDELHRQVMSDLSDPTYFNEKKLNTASGLKNFANKLYSREQGARIDSMDRPINLEQQQSQTGQQHKSHSANKPNYQKKMEQLEQKYAKNREKMARNLQFVQQKLEATGAVLSSVADLSPNPDKKQTQQFANSVNESSSRLAHAAQRLTGVTSTPSSKEVSHQTVENKQPINKPITDSSLLAKAANGLTNVLDSISSKKITPHTTDKKQVQPTTQSNKKEDSLGIELIKRTAAVLSTIGKIAKVGFVGLAKEGAKAASFLIKKAMQSDKQQTNLLKPSIEKVEKKEHPRPEGLMNKEAAKGLGSDQKEADKGHKHDGVHHHQSRTL
ncbi:MAG: hypothetical protein K2Q14_02810 [Gammaproteobacteria bacterium]|nr:hypothetical protein [Gammaproteobacteria bacterium]